MSIITPSGWLARYTTRDHDRVEDLPVAYFRRVDDEPMVVVPGEPRPRPAITLPGFKGLVACPTTATAIPSAPGWLLQAKDEQGNGHTTPIIGWVVDERGDGAPLVVYNRNGRCYSASQVFNEYTVHGPVPLGPAVDHEVEPADGALPEPARPEVRSALPASRTRRRGTDSSGGNGS
jgi:hypothetical protein